MITDEEYKAKLYTLSNTSSEYQEVEKKMHEGKSDAKIVVI